MAKRKNRQINGDVLVIDHYTAIAVRQIVYAAERRAKNKSVPFDGIMPILQKVVQEARQQNGKCACCGVSFMPGKDMVDDASMTIHRVRPEKGYSVDNIAVICYKCNSAIGEPTDMEGKAKVWKWQIEKMSIDNLGSKV